MILLNKNGASFYQFPLFRKFSSLDHAVFARHGGYSQAPFNSLNVGLGIGDDATHVRKNRRIISECIDLQHLVFANQAHGAQVIVCDGEQQSTDIGESAPAFNGDAMVTHLPQRDLVIQLPPIDQLFDRRSR